MGIGAIEKRLNAVEDELKALKATYNISGALAKMYHQVSGQFLVGGEQGLHDARIRFTPTYGRGQMNLISLFAYVNRSYYGRDYINYIPFFVEPQDGSGSVVVRVLDCYSDDVITVIASGTSLGEFSRIS